MSGDLKEKLYLAREECECALANFKTAMIAISEQLANMRLIRNQIKSVRRELEKTLAALEGGPTDE